MKDAFWLPANESTVLRREAVWGNVVLYDTAWDGCMVLCGMHQYQ